MTPTEANPQTRPAGAHVHFVVAVPDEAAARAFVEIAVPSLLGSGNLPALGDVTIWRMRIFTPDRLVGVIKSAGVFWSLERLARPEFVSLRDEGAGPVRSAARAMRGACNDALGDQAAIVMLHADAVYPAGFLARVLRDVHGGTPGLAVLPLMAHPALAQELAPWRNDADGSLDVPCEPLVRLALGHLAPAMRACFWDAPEVARDAAAVLVRVNPATVIAHPWRLWPVMLRPVRACTEFDDPVDTGDLFHEVLEDARRVVVFHSSQEIVVVRCGSAERGATLRGPMTPTMLARSRLFRATAFQRQTFDKPIVLGGGGDDPHQREHLEGVEVLVHTALLRPVLAALEPTPSSVARKVARGAWRMLRLRAGLPALAGRAVRGLRPRRLASALSRKGIAIVERAARQYVRLLARRPGFTREAAIRLHRQTGQAVNSVLREYSRNETAAMALQVGLSSLDDGRLDIAQKGLDLAWAIRPSAELEFYARLTVTLATLKTQADELGAGLLSLAYDRPRFVFAAVVWGDDYVDNFMKYTVRTMLAPGNLPALADAHVFFSIVTTESGVARIRSHASFAELSRHARVHFFVFPESLTKPFHYSRPNFDFYRLYGALDHTSIHFARALKAGIFFIVVDGLLSSNTLGTLRRYLDEGYWICANASIVSNRETLLPALDRLYDGQPCIDIPARELINLGLEHCHHYIAQRLVVPENRDFDRHPRELYFPTEDGIVVHALYQHPLVISAEAICGDIAFDYFIVDAKLMARILHDPARFEKLKVITDSDEAYVANFAPRSRHFETTGRPLDEKDFVAVHLHSEPVHHYIWKHRQLLRCDTGLRTHKDPEVVAERLLTALLAAKSRR